MENLLSLLGFECIIFLSEHAIAPCGSWWAILPTPSPMDQASWTGPLCMALHVCSLASYCYSTEATLTCTSRT